jgi:predicted DNA-binding transcriptional regulator YafY
MKAGKGSHGSGGKQNGASSVGSNGKNSAELLWDGVPLPTGPLKDRMDHINEVLQRVRRLDHHGTMKLPTAPEFAADLGITEKWVRETIAKMQDLYNIPVAYNTRRHGYEYTEDVLYSPYLQLSESELVAVYLTQQLGVFQNTPFRARLKSAFKKLMGIFGKKLSFDPRLLEKCFSFEAAGPYARFRPAHLDACVRAMMRQEELILTYTKQHGEGAGVPEVRRVRPLHITYRDFAYYALCWDLNRKEPRLFMVARMNAVEETGVRFERPKRFNARAYLEKAFKVFASKEAVRVVLEFAPSAVARVMERRWHSTQKFTKLDGGRLRMTMQVGLAPDLFSWIGGFFGECRVIEPVELRETMRGLHLGALKLLKG